MLDCFTTTKANTTKKGVRPVNGRWKEKPFATPLFAYHSMPTEINIREIEHVHSTFFNGRKKLPLNSATMHIWRFCTHEPMAESMARVGPSPSSVGAAT